MCFVKANWLFFEKWSIADSAPTMAAVQIAESRSDCNWGMAGQWRGEVRSMPFLLPNHPSLVFGFRAMAGPISGQPSGHRSMVRVDYADHQNDHRTNMSPWQPGKPSFLLE